LKILDFIAWLTLRSAGLKLLLVPSKVRQAGFARKVCSGAIPHVQVYLPGLALDDQLVDGLSAKSHTRSPRRGRVKTVSGGNRTLKAAFPLTLAAVQVMTLGRE
jgi:hypothetical protein